MLWQTMTKVKNVFSKYFKVWFVFNFVLNILQIKIYQEQNVSMFIYPTLIKSEVEEFIRWEKT